MPDSTEDRDEAERLAEVVRRAVARVPFYREHLAGADPTDFGSLPSFDKRMTERWGRFPLSAGGADGAHRVLATSGTSGDRLWVAFDRQDWERTGAWLERAGRSADMGPGDVLVNTHCYGLWVGGPALDQLAHRTGACLVPVGPDDPARVLELLADGVGTAISATPSYIRRLVEAADAAGFDLARTPLRAGFIGAEPAEQALRDGLSARLPEGFRWVELYGLTETVGPSVAFSPDPAVAELALNVGDFRVEVLDLSADEPVPFGAVGELTITGRWPDSRTPLIRYRTRDLVRATAGDPRAPMRVSRILGRADHSLKIGGVLTYPSSVAEIVSDILPARRVAGHRPPPGPRRRRRAADRGRGLTEPVRGHRGGLSSPSRPPRDRAPSRRRWGRPRTKPGQDAADPGRIVDGRRRDPTIP